MRVRPWHLKGFFFFAVTTIHIQGSSFEELSAVQQLAAGDGALRRISRLRWQDGDVSLARTLIASSAPSTSIAATVVDRCCCASLDRAMPSVSVSLIRHMLVHIEHSGWRAPDIRSPDAPFHSHPASWSGGGDPPSCFGASRGARVINLNGPSSGA
ncbi:hypothetical protein J3F83DRAFT_710522 [Trichoderma novae-zelandiae]